MSKPAPAGCRELTVPLAGIGEPAFTKDGRHVFVPGRSSHTLVVFARDPATGALTESACLSRNAVAGCTQVANEALHGAIGTALSPDERTLYVTGNLGNAIGWFPLGANHLPQTAGSGCLSTPAAGSCGDARGLIDATVATVTHDGQYVYTAAWLSHTVAAFKRDASGALTQPMNKKCFRWTGANADGQCVGLSYLRSPRDIEAIPNDDQHVLVASSGCRTTDCASLLEFYRASGELFEPPGKSSCLTGVAGSANCNTAPFDPDQIAITPDGRQILLAGRGSRTLGVVDRNPATGALTVRAGTCANAPGCSVTAPAIGSPFDVTLSPSGDAIYLADLQGRVDVFDRAANGSFAVKPAPFNCIGVSCPSPLSPAVAAVEYAVPSPDGRHVYAMYGDRIWTLLVDRPPVCASFAVEVPFNTTVPIQLQCSDPDGEPVSDVRVLSQPGRGVLIQQGDVVQYGPLVGTSGADSFTYTATAGGIDADPATVSINVAGPSGVVPSSTCVDGDGDGFCAGTQDCDDGNPAIRPGIREVLGNNIDENCDGEAEPFPLLTTGVNGTWNVKGARITLRGLLLRTPLPNGLSAEIRCKGKGCPFKVRKLKGKIKKGTLDAYKSLGGKVRFRAGQTIEVRISAPGFNTKVFRYNLRKGKLPVGTTLCLPPGVKTPQRRC